MSAVPLDAVTPPRRADRRTAIPATIGTLKRVRWAVRATLLLGVAASVAANILHAQPHLVSQIIAAWPPVALLLTVELISRVPVHRKLLAAARLIATTAIAGIAAWVSYWHMVAVAARYGETGLSAYLLPISVDGLVVVASISLVELSGRLRLAQSSPPALSAPQRTRSSRLLAAEPPAAASSFIAPANAVPVDDATADDSPLADRVPTSDQWEPAADHDPAAKDESAGEEPSPDLRGSGSGHEPHRDDDGSDDEGPGDDARQRRRRGATRKAVIDAYRGDPTKHPKTIAEDLGISERTVRRYLDELRAGTRADTPSRTNGVQHTNSHSPRQPTARDNRLPRQ